MDVSAEFESSADEFLGCFRQTTAEHDAKEAGDDAYMRTEITKIGIEVATSRENPGAPAGVIVFLEKTTFGFLPIPAPTSEARDAISAIDAIRTKPQISSSTWWLTFIRQETAGNIQWVFKHADVADEQHPRSRWEDTSWVGRVLGLLEKNGGIKGGVTPTL
jgi:hypothetical protein